jgi:predicted DsbA family dithiol-disulfide isomerase
MAFESPHITASCIEATEFMDLSRKHRVTGVPKTVVNDSVDIMGAVPEEIFVKTVVDASVAAK